MPHAAGRGRNTASTISEVAFSVVVGPPRNLSYESVARRGTGKRDGLNSTLPPTPKFSDGNPNDRSAPAADEVVRPAKMDQCVLSVDCAPARGAQSTSSPQTSSSAVDAQRAVFGRPRIGHPGSEDRAVLLLRPTPVEKRCLVSAPTMCPAATGLLAHTRWSL